MLKISNIVAHFILLIGALIPIKAQAASAFPFKVDIYLLLPFLLGIVVTLVCVLVFSFTKARKLKSRAQLSNASNEHSQDSSANFSLDPITNIPSMQRTVDVFERYIKDFKAENFVVIAFKPINFEQLNNVLGHQNADLLLLQLAYKIHQKFSENSSFLNLGTEELPYTLCRLQGLDFALIADKRKFKYEDEHVIKDLCQQIAIAIPGALSVKNFSLNFHLSFGIALGHNQYSATELLSQASDALLISEKHNTFISYFDQNALIYSEKQLVKMEKLRLDIKENRLHSLVQPQVNLNSGDIVGFELRVDWQPDAKETLDKAVFEEIAEFSGVIYQITKHLIKDAFKVVKLARARGVECFVAVDLSSRDLLQPELADFIESQALINEVPLSSLVVEMSEGTILNDAFRARMMIDQLRALGVQIAVDNFSGSYESLKYLRKASVQQVKIDCLHLGEEDFKADKTIVNALINLIRKMEIPIVATNVNKTAIKQTFASLGGQLGQGKIIHPGLTLEELESWLNSWQSQHKAN